MLFSVRISYLHADQLNQVELYLHEHLYSFIFDLNNFTPLLISPCQVTLPLCVFMRLVCTKRYLFSGTISHHLIKITEI